MGYFDYQKNVQDYIKMVDGFDGSELIKELKRHLKDGSTVLELGMGPGKDLDILKKSYQVTGSDNSEVFVDLYKKKNPDSNIMLLDAVTMKTKRKFDCIYSNKVLHHLTKSELDISFQNQLNILNDDGVLFHSFWYGDKEEYFKGLRFVYYTEASVKEIISDSWEVLEFKRYKELEKDDSFFIVLKKRDIC